MSFRTALLPTLDRLRALTGPLGFDVRTMTVTRRIRSWTGTEDGGPEVGTGSYEDDDLTLDPRPKCRETADGLLVGPITPEHASGGYAPSDLNPQELEAGQETYYVVTGPGGTHRYMLASIDDSKPFRYMLSLRLLERDIPV